VPDDDLAASVRGIFDAAARGGVKETLTVVLPGKAKLDEKSLGGLKLSKTKDGLEISGLPVAAEAARRKGSVGQANPDPRRRPLDPRGGDRFAGTAEAQPNEAYRALIAARKVSHEGAVAGYHASEGGAGLSVAAGKDGLVTMARHSGATGALRSVLDVVCGYLEGRPLQEGADHAVIRAEAALRDKSKPRPVAGILTPDNADPLFRVPTKLVRDIFKQWAKATGFKPAWNMWDDKPGPMWGTWSEEERRRMAGALLGKDVEIVAILNDVRLVVHSDDKDFGRKMISLERKLKDSLDPRLELQLEGKEDRNQRISRTKRSADKKL
jgi:hypothetical protein